MCSNTVFALGERKVTLTFTANSTIFFLRKRPFIYIGLPIFCSVYTGVRDASETFHLISSMNLSVNEWIFIIVSQFIASVCDSCPSIQCVSPSNCSVHSFNWLAHCVRPSAVLVRRLCPIIHPFDGCPSPQ